VQLEKKQAYATVNQMIQATLFWAFLGGWRSFWRTSWRDDHAADQRRSRGDRGFAKGQLDQRVQVGARNELGALADTFTPMADQLPELNQRLSAAVNLNRRAVHRHGSALAEAIDEKTRTRGALRARQPVRRSSRKQMGLGKKRDLRGPHLVALPRHRQDWHRGQDLRKPAALTDESTRS